MNKWFLVGRRIRIRGIGGYNTPYPSEYLPQQHSRSVHHESLQER